MKSKPLTWTRGNRYLTRGYGMYCKDCKYFRPARDGYDAEKNNNTCDNDKFFIEYIGQVTPHNALVYWDYEGYSAGFYVGEEFGCIHFENISKP